MRTRETFLFIALVALALLPLAAAQEEEPSVNESDFNTTEPESDESYLDDAEAEAAGEPTLGESDFDTTAPTADESYLDEAEREIDGAESGDGSAKTPGLPLAGALAAFAAAGLVARRR